MWQEKWGVKSKARKVGHKVESEKCGEKSEEKRKVGRDKSEAREKWGEKSLGIDKIGTRKVGQRGKYSEKSTGRKVRVEKWVTKWGVKSEPRKVG